MKSLHVEMLLGHSTGLAESYYRPQESEFLDEYLKAVPDLTIFEERPENVNAEEIDSLKAKVEDQQEVIKG